VAPSTSAAETVSASWVVGDCYVAQGTAQATVLVRNNGTEPADIGDWTLRDKNTTRQRFDFPPGTMLGAGETIQIYTEPGHPYSFNSGSAIWNNCGDAVELLDANGHLVATYAYGNHLLK